MSNTDDDVLQQKALWDIFEILLRIWVLFLPTNFVSQVQKLCKILLITIIIKQFFFLIKR